MIDLSSSNKTVYTFDPNGNREFEFPHRFFSAEEIEVFALIGVVERQLLRGTDFAVEEKSDYSSGAKITILDNDLEACSICIIRKIPLEQQCSLTEEGKLPAAELERCLDRFTMICQQLQEQADRSLKWSGAYNSGTLPPQELLLGAVAAARRCLEILESLQYIEGQARASFASMQQLVDVELAAMLADAQNKIKATAADFAAAVAVLSEDLYIELPRISNYFVPDTVPLDLSKIEEWEWKETLEGLSKTMDDAQVSYRYGMQIDGEDYYYPNEYSMKYYQALIDKIPRNLGGHTLTIYLPYLYIGSVFSVGDGSEEKTIDRLCCGGGLVFAGFYNGKLVIHRSPGEGGASTVLNPDGNAGIVVKDCRCEVEIAGIEFRSVGEAVCNVLCESSPAVHVTSCVFADAAIGEAAILLNNSNATVIDFNHDFGGYVSPAGDQNTFCCSPKIAIVDVRNEYFVKNSATENN